MEDSGEVEEISEKKEGTSGRNEVTEDVKRVKTFLEHNRHIEETGMKCLCVLNVFVQFVNHIISHQFICHTST